MQRKSIVAFKNHFFLQAIMTLALGFTLSQAQVTWQTTHTTVGGYNSGACSLVRSTVNVKVFPAYLDVEEDVEIGVGGTVSTGNDAATLEITGNFSLPSGGAIVGALLWDGSTILQGKLLDKATADSIYADLVDRNSTPPPRPRDPLIIEQTGTNAYRFRIYPVELGHSRHFRLRYQLPPKIGVDGFEMRMVAPITPLFVDASATVNVNLATGFVDDSPTNITFVENGLKRQIQLPRSLFLSRASLTASHATGIRILPPTPQRQVMVKTSFPSGSFTGNYINLYAGVTEDVMRGFGQRIEVVILWKWHNPGTWIQKTPSGGEVITSYVTTAQSQASQLLSLYGLLGVPGTRVGLLHDDSRNIQRNFPVAAKTDAGYQQATDYLRSVQGAYVEQFVRSLQILPGGGAQIDGINASKNRFLDNVRIVKTLYSPDEGIVRHLLVVSVGPEFALPDQDLNAAFDQILADKPVSISTMKNWGFDQVGLDVWGARATHAYQGTTVSTTYADLPGFSAMSLIATVRNAGKAYDFNIACSAALGINCGTLEFHGKSTAAWEDSLSWEAYRSDGVLLGRTRTLPWVIAPEQDTGTAILWAGSATPFSEKKELPLGPVYGFVDKWANLLALEQDSLTGPAALAYADSGVPRISNEEIADVIPNYEGQTVPGGGSASLADALKASMKNPASWRVEHGRNGQIVLRIPGLAAGAKVELELFSLDGKRAGSWALQADPGFLRWNTMGVRSGPYLLRVRVNGIQGVKRIVL